MYALVDCNYFYASCEQLFQPDLKHRALIVLSNNDGCVVARSAQAKALGIKIGTPVFKLHALIQHHRIVVRSSNYALYADLSHRVMQTLELLAPRVEVYSIDEAFLDLTGLSNLTDLGHHIRRTIARWVGLPVCVGIAPSKTLAKLDPATGGVGDLTDPSRRVHLLERIDASKVWGVGPRLTRQLSGRGIHTAADLARADAKVLRREGSVMLERTILELRGILCLSFGEAPEPEAADHLQSELPKENHHERGHARGRQQLRCARRRAPAPGGSKCASRERVYPDQPLLPGAAAC